MAKKAHIRDLSIFEDEKVLKQSLDEVRNNYRPYDPGSYLYNKLLTYAFEDKFSDEFIELVYVTLSAWNMNSRGAKLNEFTAFKDTIRNNKALINEFASIHIVTSESISALQDLRPLFMNLKLVADGKPPLVTFSKTLHFYLPDLIIPIDRRYTLNYFQGHTNLPTKLENQFTRFLMIESAYAQFAEGKELSIHLDKNWNRNIPKLLDNMVIGYIRIHDKN